eukprot:10327280-Alexandrium_andersonii.AAC.1
MRLRGAVPEFCVLFRRQVAVASGVSRIHGLLAGAGRGRPLGGLRLADHGFGGWGAQPRVGAWAGAA